MATGDDIRAFNDKTLSWHRGGGDPRQYLNEYILYGHKAMNDSALGLSPVTGMAAAYEGKDRFSRLQDIFNEKTSLSDKLSQAWSTITAPDLTKLKGTSDQGWDPSRVVHYSNFKRSPAHAYFQTLYEFQDDYNTGDEPDLTADTLRAHRNSSTDYSKWDGSERTTLANQEAFFKDPALTLPGQPVTFDGAYPRLHGKFEEYLREKGLPPLNALSQQQGTEAFTGFDSWLKNNDNALWSEKQFLDHNMGTSRGGGAASMYRSLLDPIVKGNTNIYTPLKYAAGAGAAALLGYLLWKEFQPEEEEEAAAKTAFDRPAATGGPSFKLPETVAGAALGGVAGVILLKLLSRRRKKAYVPAAILGALAGAATGAMAGGAARKFVANNRTFTDLRENGLSAALPRSISEFRNYLSGEPTSPVLTRRVEQQALRQALVGDLDHGSKHSALEKPYDAPGFPYYVNGVGMGSDTKGVFKGSPSDLLPYSESVPRSGKITEQRFQLGDHLFNYTNPLKGSVWNYLSAPTAVRGLYGTETPGEFTRMNLPD